MHATDSPLGLPLGVFRPMHATDSLQAPEFLLLFKFLHHACLRSLLLHACHRLRVPSSCYISEFVLPNSGFSAILKFLPHFRSSHYFKYCYIFLPPYILHSNHLIPLSHLQTGFPPFSDSPTSLFGGGCLSHHFGVSLGFTGLLICGCLSSLNVTILFPRANRLPLFQHGRCPSRSETFQKHALACFFLLTCIYYLHASHIMLTIPILCLLPHAQ